MLFRIISLSLLSVCGLFALDVKTFGAVGSGQVDDTAALQNAINACPTNGTLTISPGNYLVSGLYLKSNCTYTGGGSTTLTLSQNNGFILHISEQSNITISGINLNSNFLGGGIIAQDYAPAQGIQITNCQFRNISPASWFPSNLAIVSTFGLINSSIQNNSFQNIAGGIWLTAVENVSILNNSFLNVTQGNPIYVAPSPVSFPSGDNLIISGNTGSKLARIAIELFRPDPPNGSVLTAPTVTNNSFSDWTGWDGAGLSIAHGDGATISGNRITNNGPMQGAGIEVVIKNGKIQGNVIAGGFAAGIAVQGTPGSNISGNTITGAGDSGIILSCDNGHGRCNSTGTTISGNTIRNAFANGIKLDNDWSNSLISRNTIIRTAGYFPGDGGVMFDGIHQSWAPGTGVIDSNTTIQDATIPPPGFWFCGVHINSSMPGSYVTNNLTRSNSNWVMGTGVIDNTGNATRGWILAGNTVQNSLPN